MRLKLIESEVSNLEELKAKGFDFKQEYTIIKILANRAICFEGVDIFGKPQKYTLLQNINSVEPIISQARNMVKSTAQNKHNTTHVLNVSILKKTLIVGLAVKDIIPLMINSLVKKYSLYHVEYVIICIETLIVGLGVVALILLLTKLQMIDSLKSLDHVICVRI